MELIERLIRACVAGCTCNTKSPDIQHHDPQCHYRLFIEAGDQIAELEAALIYVANVGSSEVKQRVLETLRKLNGEPE